MIITSRYLVCVGRDNVDGIATGYGLDGPGIKTQWGRDFSDTSRSASRATHPYVPGSFPAGKSAGSWSRPTANF